MSQKEKSGIGSAAKVLEGINAGLFNRRELENLRTNALAKGRYPEIVDACSEQLERMPARKRGGSSPSATIIEVRKKVAITADAIGPAGTLRIPELMHVAEMIAECPFVRDVSILKSQVRFYLRERHMIAGKSPGNKGYWAGVLDEKKLKDSTVLAWGQMATLARGTYFATNYLDAHVADLEQLRGLIGVAEFV
jgi:hypothetical protein